MPKKAVKVSSELKSILDSRKTHPDQTYESVISSALVPQNIFSSLNPINDPVVGASSGDSEYTTYSKVLGWISNTEGKLPGGERWDITPELRQKAFDTDPLIRGVISPFLKNIILNNYDIVTTDNKKCAMMIKDIKSFLEEIEYMDTMRDGFDSLNLIHGHQYHRKDYFGDFLSRLQLLEAKGMTVYEDPWKSYIRAYHQRIAIKTTWALNSDSETTYDSWFIPDGKPYIESEGITEGKAEWDEFAKARSVSDVTNLRVDSADKIIPMHRVKPGRPAPIDSVILAIWLKRLILSNSPQVIFRVLFPFLQLINGVILEVTNPDGTKKIITSVPQNPAAGMATTDPEKYAEMAAAYTAYETAKKNDIDNIQKYMADGGTISTGPDKELKVIESGNNITSGFIQTLLRELNNEIGQNYAFPISLIDASGNELATQRAILDLVFTNYKGQMQDYEKIANELIAERFEGMSWSYSITNKDGSEETGTITFEEAEVQFKLSTGDTKDALKEAQVRLTVLQGLQAAKALGASRADIQALGDEAGLGLLDLEKFDAQQQSPFSFGGAGGGGMNSTIGTDTEPDPIPKNEDEKLTQELMAVYQEAQKAMGDLFQ